MTASLLIFPYPTVNFGFVITGQHIDQDVVIQNSGDEPCTIAQWSIDNPLFTIVSSTSPLPVTLTPGDAGVAVTLRYAPLAMTTDTGVFTILSDAITTPDLVNLLGAGVTSGTAAISVSPAQGAFPETKTGATSAAITFTITNTSDVDVTVSAITVPTGFTLSIDPTPVTLSAGQTATFDVEFTPAADGYFSDNVQLTNTTATNPWLVPVTGLSNPIDSVWTVTGQTKQTLLGLNSLAGGPILNYLNSGLGLDTQGSCVKQFDFWFPQADFPIRGYEKGVYRFEIYYEDLGNFELTVELISRRNQLVTQTQAIVGNSDGRTKTAIFDFNVSDEIVEMVLLQNSGRMSIVLILFSIAPGAEIVKNT